MPRTVTRLVACLCLLAALSPAVAGASTSPPQSHVVLQGPGMWPLLPRPAEPPAGRPYVSWPVPAASAPIASGTAAASAGDGIPVAALIATAGGLMLLGATFTGGVHLGRHRARTA